MDGDGGVDEMGAPAQGAQHPPGLLSVGRLAQDLPLQIHHGVRRQDQGLGGLKAGRLDLGPGQPGGAGRRPLARLGAFIDFHREDLHGMPEERDERATPRRGGSQDPALRDHGFGCARR
jgi:hypothetical protein